MLGVRHMVHGKAYNFIPIDEKDKTLSNATFIVHLGSAGPRGRPPGATAEGPSGGGAQA